MFSDEDSDIFDRDEEKVPDSVREENNDSNSSSDICIPLSPLLSREALDDSMGRRHFHQGNINYKPCLTISPQETLPVREEKAQIIQKTPEKAGDLCFSDEDSFEIVAHDIKENHNKLSPVPTLFMDSPQHDEVMEEDNEVVRPSSPSIAQLTESYMKALKEMEDIDEMARQLKMAVELQKQSEKCSYRGIDALFKCNVEATCLSTGSQLFILHAINNSQYDINEWILTISWKTLDLNSPARHIWRSQSLDLGNFAIRQKKSFQTLISSNGYQPLLFTIEIHRMFNIDGVLKYFRIPLTSSIHNTLNLFQMPEKIVHLKEKRIVSSLVIPCALVKLLAGERSDESSADLLRFLLRPSSLDKKITTASTTSVFLSLSNAHNEVVTFTVKKEREMYNLDIYIKDPQNRKTIVQDIQLYVIFEISLLKNNPKQHLSNISDVLSISQLYDTLVNKYK